MSSFANSASKMCLAIAWAIAIVPCCSAGEIDGEWKVVSGRRPLALRSGRADFAPKDHIEKWRITIAKGVMTQSSVPPGVDLFNKAKIIVRRAPGDGVPGQIDLVPFDGEQHGRILEGLYEVGDGEAEGPPRMSLIYSLDPARQKRPPSFEDRRSEECLTISLEQTSPGK